jgi:hypothetical protein
LVQPDLPIHLAAVLGSADRSRAHFLPPVWDRRRSTCRSSSPAILTASRLHSSTIGSRARTPP